MPAFCALYVLKAQGSLARGSHYCTHSVCVRVCGVPYLSRTVAPQATTYLVMELLPGGDIFEQVIRRFGRATDETDESGYTEGDACDIMRMALSAVAHLHASP